VYQKSMLQCTRSSVCCQNQAGGVVVAINPAII